MQRELEKQQREAEEREQAEKEAKAGRVANGVNCDEKGICHPTGS